MGRKRGDLQRYDDPEEVAYYHALYPEETLVRLGQRFGITRQTVAAIIKRTQVDAARVAQYREKYYDKLGDKLVDVGILRQRIIIEGEAELEKLVRSGSYGSAKDLSQIVSQTQGRDALSRGQPTSITAHLDALPVDVIRGLVLPEGEHGTDQQSLAPGETVPALAQSAGGDFRSSPVVPGGESV